MAAGFDILTGVSAADSQPADNERFPTAATETPAVSVQAGETDELPRLGSEDGQ